MEVIGAGQRTRASFRAPHAAIERGDIEVAYGIVAALSDFAKWHGILEIGDWASQALTLPDTDDHPLRVEALYAAVSTAGYAHQHSDALRRHIGEIERIGPLHPTDPDWLRARTAALIATKGPTTEDYLTIAEPCARAALEAGDDYHAAEYAFRSAYVHQQLGRPEPSRKWLETVEEVLARYANPGLESSRLMIEGLLAEDRATARARLLESAQIAEDSGCVHAAFSGGLAIAAQATPDDLPTLAATARDLVTDMNERGNRVMVYSVLADTCALLTDTGHQTEAHKLAHGLRAITRPGDPNFNPDTPLTTPTGEDAWTQDPPNFDEVLTYALNLLDHIPEQPPRTVR